MAGLGNPDFRYFRTRHNFGFLAVDYLADVMKGRIIERNSCYSLFEGRLENSDILLMKPTTYMNRSGEAISDFYKKNGTAGNFIVIHDDIDLEFGRMKIKNNGGDGGHKGIRSIIDCLERNDFTRLRLGIRNNLYEGNTEGFVLSDFSPSEEKAIPSVLKSSSDAVKHIIANGIFSAMNKYNGLRSVNDIEQTNQ